MSSSITSDNVGKAILAKRRLLNRLSRFWQQQTGRDQVDRRTIATVSAYVAEVGIEQVLDWIVKASTKANSDRDIGRYVSGCRRTYLREMQGGREEGAVRG